MTRAKADGGAGAHGFHLTKTQRELLRFIAGETALNGGVCCTKRDLADLTGRNVKTIDRCLSALRRDGLVEAEMRFGENGAQLGSCYRTANGSARAPTAGRVTTEGSDSARKAVGNETN